MSDILSTADTLESGNTNDQKVIREEVTAIATKARVAMDKGLTTDEMTKTKGVKEAADAAAEILSRIY